MLVENLRVLGLRSMIASKLSLLVLRSLIISPSWTPD